MPSVFGAEQLIAKAPVENASRIPSIHSFPASQVSTAGDFLNKITQIWTVVAY